MPTIAAGVPYSGFIQLSGATSAYATGLPPGLTSSFSVATQRITVSGTPTQSGSYYIGAMTTNACPAGAPKYLLLGGGQLIVGSAGPVYGGFSEQMDNCTTVNVFILWAAVAGATDYEIESLLTPGTVLSVGPVTNYGIMSLLPPAGDPNDGVRIRAITPGGPSGWTYTGPILYSAGDPNCSPQP
jgi:hypothetical protein